MAVNNEEISFARKYRPVSLDGYIGNVGVKDTVKRYLKNGRPQSILLTGSSGCGKTTMARLLAKEYLCENRDPEKGSCGQCLSCQTIEEYIRTGVNDMLPDIYEIDSSDKSGKKDIDSLLSTIDYPAMNGSWKVYIIDEIHNLSEGAMGRLLKNLEEPPEGVLMIFCTTNPEKVLDTIKNRCQLRLEVSKPSTKDIIKMLQGVCIREEKNYDIAGLRLIATRANNVVRESLNLVERVINTRGDATAKNVSAEFSEVSDKIIFDFYKAYLRKDYMEYINILYTIKTVSTFPQFLTTLTNFTIRGIYIVNSVDVDGLSEEELLEYKKLFQLFSPKEISYILSSLRKMGIGDIEANFIAFIYTDFNENYNNSDNKEDNITIVKSTLESESELREANRERTENLKLAKGVNSLKDEFREVSFSDVSSELFQLEKVDSTTTNVK